MYPYIHLGTLNFDLGPLHFHGPVELGTFGLLLWLAAVCATIVLHLNFARHKVRADALNIVDLATVAGVIGAKLWHVMETPRILFAYPAEELLNRAGFAWFGGLLAAILVLLWQGTVRYDGKRTGPMGMLDLAAPAAAIGYGVGRIGCLLSGDGDYGIPTTLPWAVTFPHGLVPTTAYVHPTPVYEFLFAVAVAAWLWREGGKPQPVGWLTGQYLLLSGFGRFLVEFIRINPKILWGMSNAQVAAIGSMIAGAALMVAVHGHRKLGLPEKSSVAGTKPLGA